MFYLLWILGMAFVISFTAVIVMSIDRSGKFDE